MNVGCQTITFGDDQHDHFDSVFTSIRAAGYEGVEIGYRRIADCDPLLLRELLDKNELELFGSHIGGNLEDSGQADGERALLEEILDYLQKLDVTVLMYSGLRFDTDDQFNSDLAMIRRSAEQAAQRGVRLLYHNHYWEMRDDARILRTLVDEGGDHLGFCPDVGWVFKGGADIIQTLELLRGRIGVVHFKDFAFPGTGEDHELCDTVEFGKGVVPLADAARWVKVHAPEAWAVAEQDISVLEPAMAVRENAACLAHLIKSLVVEDSAAGRISPKT